MQKKFKHGIHDVRKKEILEKPRQIKLRKENKRGWREEHGAR